MDGSALQWNYYGPLDGLTEDEVKNLLVKDLQAISKYNPNPKANKSQYVEQPTTNNENFIKNLKKKKKKNLLITKQLC